MEQQKQREWRYKIISLVLALIIWIYVAGEQGQDAFFYRTARGLQKQEFRDVPVCALVGGPAHFQAVTIAPDRMNVDVIGPRKKIEDLKKEDIILFVNTKGFVEGTYDMVIDARLPAGVQLSSLLAPVVVTLSSPPTNSNEKVVNLAEQLLKETSS